MRAAVTVLICSFLIALSACASAESALPASHPASTAAIEAPPLGPSVLARAEKGPLFPVDETAPMPEGHHHHHGGMAMPPAAPPSTTTPTSEAAPSPRPPASVEPAPGHDHDGPPATAAPATTAPKTQSTSPTTTAPTASDDVYSCPMHPEVTSTKPGKCPKCGMALKKKEKR